ncbi:hypothetical protein J132_01256 [Termitomyces sp. J132]|nr:hypothetical protein H2248_007271 [Termitomyces sp. 'cryptogamus']KNZ78277.1 hypothetical protein J132_01256 [Termitomyces sp. J132]
MWPPLSEPLPPTINDLLVRRNELWSCFPASRASEWRVSRRPLLFTKTDSPSASFYRMYQFLILNWTVPFRNELEYFCIMHPHWAIADLPDPKDTKDPTRYAALAGMAYLLCDAFNRRIELGLPRDAPPIVEDWEELARRPKVLECVPQWAKKVAPLPTMSYIPGENGQTVDEDDTEVCERLKKFNLIMRQPHIHFI